MNRDNVVMPEESWTLADAIKYVYGFGRSQTVHGGRFVLMDEHRQARELAAEMTRLALIVFQQELQDYESRFKRNPAADSKKAFLGCLKARGSRA